MIREIQKPGTSVVGTYTFDCSAKLTQARAHWVFVLFVCRFRRTPNHDPFFFVFEPGSRAIVSGQRDDLRKKRRHQGIIFIVLIFNAKTKAHNACGYDFEAKEECGDEETQRRRMMCALYTTSAY